MLKVFSLFIDYLTPPPGDYSKSPLCPWDKIRLIMHGRVWCEIGELEFFLQ
eukprot:Pgem_evm1s16738